MADSDGAARERATAALRDLILASEFYRHTLAEHFDVGVTETQAMSYLAARGPMGQTDLAADIGITTSSATSLIDRMEKAGVVRREPHPSDRRRVVVSLTERGNEIVSYSRGWLSNALQTVHDDRLPELEEMLSSLAAKLREQSRTISAGVESGSSIPPRSGS